jgi:hypothetical protein
MIMPSFSPHLHNHLHASMYTPPLPLHFLSFQLWGIEHVP